MTPEPIAALAVDDARRLVDDERDHIDEKLAAFDRFADGLRRLPTDSPSPATRSTTTGTGPPGSISAAAGGRSAGDDTTRRVRSLFAETVRPYSIEDVDEPEPLLVSIREELTPEIALAVAPSTDRAFTPELRTAIYAAVDQSQAELRAMRQGLATEAESLGQPPTSARSSPTGSTPVRRVPNRGSRPSAADTSDWTIFDSSLKSSLPTGSRRFTGQPTTRPQQASHTNCSSNTSISRWRSTTPSSLRSPA